MPGQHHCCLKFVARMSYNYDDIERRSILYKVLCDDTERRTINQGARLVIRNLYTNNPYLDRLTSTTAIGRCHSAEIYERAVRGNEDVVLRPLFTLYYYTISNI